MSEATLGVSNIEQTETVFSAEERSQNVKAGIKAE